MALIDVLVTRALVFKRIIETREHVSFLQKMRIRTASLKLSEVVRHHLLVKIHKAHAAHAHRVLLVLQQHRRVVSHRLARLILCCKIQVCLLILPVQLGHVTCHVVGEELGSRGA